MNETVRLAHFVAETTYSDLPGEIVEAIKVYILDNLASGLVGSVTPWTGMVAALAQESAPTGPCSIILRDWTTSPSCAALVNGTAIGGFETDHALLAGSSHPSASVFPAAQAIAERDHRDGKTLLTAVALGYELACRVGLAATRAVEDEAGFHGPGTNAPFGGAAGAGKALGLDSGQMVNALGIAGSHAGGLLEFAKEGAMTKRLHVGRGAQMGLESALLAANGFTGPSTVLEGDRGYLSVYSPAPSPERLLDGWGQRYHLLDITLKSYAWHMSFHAVVDGVRKFKERRHFQPSQVERVQVAGADRMLEARFTHREPATVLGGQYSLPFSVAIALCRDVENPLVFNQQTLWDPQVRELAQKIELSEIPPNVLTETGGGGAQITLTISGDTYIFEVTDWKGAPTNPYSYEEMADKFRTYAAPLLAPDNIDRIIDGVRGLENLPDVADLVSLVRVESPATAPS